MGEDGNKKRWGAEEIAGVLRRVNVNGVDISKVCEETGCCPSQVYRWQKQLFDGAATVFTRRNGAMPREVTVARARVEALEAKLRRKDEVLSELMEEHVALKKNLGGN